MLRRLTFIYNIIIRDMNTWKKALATNNKSRPWPVRTFSTNINPKFYPIFYYFLIRGILKTKWTSLRLSEFLQCFWWWPRASRCAKHTSVIPFKKALFIFRACTSLSRLQILRPVCVTQVTLPKGADENPAMPRPLPNSEEPLLVPGQEDLTATKATQEPPRRSSSLRTAPTNTASRDRMRSAALVAAAESREASVQASSSCPANGPGCFVVSSYWPYKKCTKRCEAEVCVFFLFESDLLFVVCLM
jgi:hypothetical protein